MRDLLSIRRKLGRSRAGARLGLDEVRPRKLTHEQVRAVRVWRQEGATYKQIQSRLEAEGARISLPMVSYICRGMRWQSLP